MSDYELSTDKYEYSIQVWCEKCGIYLGHFFKKTSLDELLKLIDDHKHSFFTEEN